MRILLVEEKKETNSLVKKSLEAEYFVVDEAKDIINGTYLAVTNTYDLILFDIKSPEKNYLKACLEIRAKKINTPILIISVKSEIGFNVNLLNAGADDYLTKPFSLDELLARMRALLRRPRQIKSEILQIDNLFLDIKKGSVLRGNKEIYLTRKEFILLHYLMQNQGIVLSRSMILEHVWDINVDPFSNTIESHILSLRKKINLISEKKLIHTINGRGYKID